MQLNSIMFKKENKHPWYVQEIVHQKGDNENASKILPENVSPHHT